MTVLTEIMFGIPCNLFAPFASLYVLALGVIDQQIGSIANLGLILPVFSALLADLYPARRLSRMQAAEALRGE